MKRLAFKAWLALQSPNALLIGGSDEPGTCRDSHFSFSAHCSKTMNQILQNYRTGELQLAEVPIPVLQSGYALVRAATSLVSTGTEKCMLEGGRKYLLGKAMERLELIHSLLPKHRCVIAH